MVITRVGFISSNQHRNLYKGLPGVTEEEVMQELTALVMRILKAETTTKIENFWIPGDGTNSIDELRLAINEANKWKPDVNISLHSDAIGSTRHDGILGIVQNDARKPVAYKLTKGVSSKLGLPDRGVWVKPDFVVVRDTNAPTYLLEISEHATYFEAKWIVDNLNFIAKAIADTMISVFNLQRREVEYMNMAHNPPFNAPAEAYGIGFSGFVLSGAADWPAYLKYGSGFVFNPTESGRRGIMYLYGSNPADQKVYMRKVDPETGLFGPIYE